MPSKPRERDRNREREQEREQDSEVEGKRHSTSDRDRHLLQRDRRVRQSGSRKSSSTTSKDRDRRRNTTVGKSSTPISSSKSRTSSMPGVEILSQPSSASFAESMTSLPYPTFSKAHSREKVGSRDNLVARLNILTPDPTDIIVGHVGNDAAKDDGANAAGVGGPETGTRATRPNGNNPPPSPPLTHVNPQSSGRGSPTGAKTGEGKRSPVKSQDEKRKPR